MALDPKAWERLRPMTWLTVVTATVALAALLAEYGFVTPLLPLPWLHTVQLATVVSLVFSSLCKGFAWGDRTRRRGLVFDVGLMMVCALLLRALPGWHWQVCHFYLLVSVIVRVGRLVVRSISFGLAPARLLIVSFAALILVGAVLLTFPQSYCGPGKLTFTDAVFTSTSAACVTGLVVNDTGAVYTRLGQVVVLVLIQVGGLGIMIFGALFALLMGSSLSMRESTAMQDIAAPEAPGRMTSAIIFIAISTVIIELIGAVGLYGMWQVDPQDPQRGGQVFNSVFHAVSAFCNAGFSLQAMNLMDYRFRVQPYLVICPLIVLGGLGYPVFRNLYDSVRTRWRKKSLLGVRSADAISLHTKLALFTTAGLLVFGWVFLVVLEWIRPGNHGLSGGILLDALFNSVTARTAGFNTMDIATCGNAAKLVIIMLMFIGGSPCSTAGGIRTVTFAVLVLTIVTTISQRPQVEAFRRSVPLAVIRRAGTLLILYGVVLWLATMLLTITESASSIPAIDLLFEATSALGTVGLSAGVTPQLTIAGKWVIIATMFIGRLGPLALLAALSNRQVPIRYEYPSEPLIVG